MKDEKQKSTSQVADILSARDAVKYRHIIERAANLGYHDYKFESIPGHPEYANCSCPKIQLLHDLSLFPELSDVTQMVCNGDFDETADEIDQAMLRTMLHDEDCPDFMFKMIGLQQPTEKERDTFNASKHLN